MKDKVNNLIGLRIKQLRKQYGYKTQESLAAALRDKYGLKTDRAMVGKWEIGYQVPEMYTVKCLADLFETTMDYLIGKEAPPLNLSKDASVKFEKLMQIVDLLTDEEWQKVMDYAALLISAQQNRKDD